MAHAPDAFSSLRSCEGAGDARRYPCYYDNVIVSFADQGTEDI